MSGPSSPQHEPQQGVIITERTGKPNPEAKQPRKGDIVAIHYRGTLHGSGREFDCTFGRDPFKTEIGTGKVIRGWDEAIPQLFEGESATLIVAPHFAYAGRGYAGLIPPEATLVFRVTLVKIIPKASTRPA